jgi:hypothetical protein
MAFKNESKTKTIQAKILGVFPKTNSVLACFNTGSMWLGPTFRC